ncbi:MAG: cation-translocating P-type ATPase [Planctomycetaceae bacterium]|nr:cation-translocating P-type ATPase [Planctomycetaceae bacterium]
MNHHAHSHPDAPQHSKCGHGCAHETELHDAGHSSSTHQAEVHSTSGQLGRRFEVVGLDCVEEVRVLKDALGPLVGGDQHLAFNVIRGELIILPTAQSISDEQIISRVAQTGMTARVINNAKPSTSTLLSQWKIFAVATSAIFFVGSFIAEVWLSGKVEVLWSEAATIHELTRGLLSLTILFSSATVVTKVWYSIRNLRLDMNALMFIAILGAIALNQWTEAATVAFLYALSLQLEAWSVYRARRAIDKLLRDDVAKVRTIDSSGREMEVAAEQLPIATRFIVRPGERINLDGEVVSGRGEINESLVTGESFPVFKNIGDGVYAGTINGPSTLTIASTRTADDTQLSRIIRLVSEHQAKKGEYETWVEQFARYYTPAVLVLALFTVLIRWLAWGEGVSDAVYNGLALLVIACPCALVISTPVSVVSALSSAARYGILVKGGQALERVGRVNSIAFDKTGTLTWGAPEVVEVADFSEHGTNELLMRFGAVSGRSEHPLAKSISAYAKEHGITIPDLQNFVAVPGSGASGEWNGKTYRIGSLDYHLNFHTLPTSAVEIIERWRKQGYSIVVLSSDRHLCGAMALRDRVRSEAKNVVTELQQRGMRSVVLLSGDHQEAVANIARELGITKYQGGMLPQGKVDFLKSMSGPNNCVAMVGDGINDAPALAAADLGIAMGAGTDVALETADVALINNDLHSLVWLVDLSRRMLSIIRQNIGLAVGIKVFFALLALMGTATLWGAIAADLGASLLVIFNGMRLLKR